MVRDSAVSAAGSAAADAASGGTPAAAGDVSGAPARTVTPADERQRAAWRNGELPRVERVRPGLWSIPVPIPINSLRYVLVYALELTSGVAIIDAGWDSDEAFTALRDGLGQAGFDISDVRAVLVTHVHPDHYGLAGRVREHSGAWIGVHPADANLVHDRLFDLGDDPEARVRELIRRDRELLERCGAPQEVITEAVNLASLARRFAAPARPDVLIEDGDRPVLPGWDLRAVWTPGHSPGHLCFVSERRRILITGDHVLPRITPIVSVHPQSSPNPLADYLDSLATIRAVGVEAGVTEVLPAHEYRFLELTARVDHLMAHHEERLAEIEAAVAAAGGASCWELASRLTWSRPWESIPQFMRRMANNETLAHLVWLESRGRVRRVPGTPDLWYPAD
ncbi:MBL fold metallo-hydrolase [Thermopolyspora flexuosa]|jgi:glyoxylase-like metal-dependent hydrolase (beta-lactamase superfamily II)|uniref:Glyoxylase-like metal-dependent hydrolase (Beta-lactamase superfamily II) n=1 Tax=Thermopolyspora flexuosa TaxID=103836 RepID=A0A543ITL0_9ACTN|nr:MBL fold metallo-hydrolase [Thermopolyspora flexuosa]TQM73918.1 glyoxylase-like metal-dependent hydrolase (beta-lactamase superfamily II) [Thermopolyspora flexuosa]GGM93193.1 MBL fold metallo-hydrolase [Thermopolyspora flexuosa]